MATNKRYDKGCKEDSKRLSNAFYLITAGAR